uniref:NADH-quinone oxidoreductase subunit N n=1 Tax=uncultured Armatimonadetes bacterium TaxID=157466 RepID=A0A6J4HWX3_9BACT|nr:NADH-ubiquinone oxidoreductase chain N [uncultured Armatimonadetes bacterium]
MNQIFESLIAVGPPMILILFGMVVLIGEVSTKNKHLLNFASMVGCALAAASAVYLLGDADPQQAFGGGMISDRFGNLFNIVLCVIAALSILMSDRYLEEKDLNHGEFYALILFSTSGAMLMAMSNDLVNVFLGLEVLSIALYILAGFARREIRSEESAVKYFLLGSFASGFFLYGTALIYGAVGIVRNSPVGNALPAYSFTNFDVIAVALDVSRSTGTPLALSPLFIVGVALVIVGLGFKAALVPFHSYAPDVYEGAPTPVTAFMSAGAKVGAFAAFIRVFEVLIPAQDTFEAVLWVLAALTMIVGNVLAIRQTNIKRMLAYSSVAHAGYILVGVLANNDLGRGAVLYYLFAYTFMNLGAFALIIWLGRENREYLEISDYAGLAKRHPFAAAVMTVFMLSLAGIPPTAGFFGKLYLFLGAVQANQVGIAVLGLLASVIGVYYYLNLIVQMYFREPEQEFEHVTTRGGARLAAVIAAAGSLVLGFISVGPFRPDPNVRTEARRAPAPPTGAPPTGAPAPPAPATDVSQR